MLESGGREQARFVEKIYTFYLDLILCDILTFGNLFSILSMQHFCYFEGD